MISITDNPIENECQDQLKVKRHSLALSNFILKSDAPLTIGLQGEWGSGKTSLMYLLREKLQKANVATAWVNTWEYSMFRGPRETTPAVLQGLLVKLKESCGDQWTLNDETKEKWKSVVKFAGALGNQVIVKQTGVNTATALHAAKSIDVDKNDICGIAEMKVSISEIINRLIDDPKNDFKRVVFFVDDLDRINPVDAVEVLESLKNVFDIPNCIFVLAIDYDVVVKGLEGKFGPKTEENEREFRSFFDKIIQLPFSMPTGTYDIDHFLLEKLREIDVEILSERHEIFGKVVKHTVGYNPRSLKRYMNSFSLLNSIRSMDEEADEGILPVDELMLFSLLGIQISYPKIFRMLITNPNFLEWGPPLASRLGLNWEEIQQNAQKFSESDLIDEDWEKVVWGSCQRDPYLRSRAGSILQLINLLRDQFGESVIDHIERALDIAAITSVDDNAEAKQAVQKSGHRFRFDSIDVKADQLRKNEVSEENIEFWTHFMNPINLACSKNTNLTINFAKTVCSLNDMSRNRKDRLLLYIVNPGKKRLGFRMQIMPCTKKIESIIENAKSEPFNIPLEYMVLNKDKSSGNSFGSLMLDSRTADLVGSEKYKDFLNMVLIELGFVS